MEVPLGAPPKAEVPLGAPKVEVLIGAPNAEVPLDRDKDGAAGPSPSSEGVFVPKLDNPKKTKDDIHVVPLISTHFRFQFLTFLILLSKKSNLQ